MPRGTTRDDKVFQKLDDLITRIDIFINTVTTHATMGDKYTHRPYGAYLSDYGYDKRNEKYRGFSHNVNDLNNEDLSRIVNKHIKELSTKLSDLNKIFTDTTKKLKETEKEINDKESQLLNINSQISNVNADTSLTDAEKKDKIDILEREKQVLELKKQTLETEKQTLEKEKQLTTSSINRTKSTISNYQSNPQRGKEFYQRQHDQLREDHGRDYDNLTDFDKQKYSSREDYINTRLKWDNEYNEDRDKRREVQGHIGSSGLQNTGAGRYVSTLVDRQQQIQDMGHFADYLTKKGGAADIGGAMFGKGSKAAGVATKTLGAFGKGLGAAVKALGPWGMAIGMAIDAVKLLAKVIGSVINEINQYEIGNYKNQADLNKLQFKYKKEETVAEIELQTKGIETSGEMQLKNLTAQGEIMLNNLKLVTQQYAKSFEIAIGPLIDGINSTAYNAANARLEAAAQAQKNALTANKLMGDVARFGATKSVELANAQKTTAANLANLKQQTDFDSMMVGINQYENEAEHLTGRFFESASGSRQEFVNRRMSQESMRDLGISDTDIQDVKKNAVSNMEKKTGYKKMSDLESALNFSIGTRKSELEKQRVATELAAQGTLFKADMNAAVTSAMAQQTQTIANINQQIGDEQARIQKEAADTVIDAALEIKKTWLKLAENTEKWLDEFDKATNSLGQSYGFTNRKQMDAFQKSMFSAGNDASYFGKTYEDIVKAQQSYIETTGRNRMFDTHDNRSLMGLGVYLGDDGLAASYASEMEIFNTGVADSVDMLDKALQSVNRMGLNGRKYTKTLVDSLKLAQKYNFKGGTENLMKMAKWAENTRFNINSLGGMLDKISEGGLEGVITQAAQLQVLGGHAAMNADPIAMMFERYADPDAFVRRMQDMTKGYGQLDRKTGETKFSGPEQMLMEAMAKAQGRPVEDLMNEVRARNKQEVVSEQLNGNFSEDEQAFISNSATYDKKTGQFKVKVKEGSSYGVKNVSELSPKDLENLMPEEHNERMEDYMQRIIDHLAKLTGEENREKLALGEAVWEERIQQYEERLDIAHQSFAKNFERYVEETKKGMDEATQSFSNYIDIFKQGNEKVDESVKNLENTANNINSVLNQTASAISAGNQAIAAAVSAGVQTVQNAAGFSQETEISSVSGGDGSTGGGGGSGRDVIVSGDGKPMISRASQITSINDGFVTTHPQDVGIFAKEGGVIGNFLNTLDKKLDLSLNNEMPMNNSFEKISSRYSSIDKSPVRIEFDTLRIDGRLELSSNGQSVDIMSEIQNNPLFIRALSRMLSEHLTNAVNGGRGNLNLSLGSV